MCHSLWRNLTGQSVETANRNLFLHKKDCSTYFNSRILDQQNHLNFETPHRVNFSQLISPNAVAIYWAENLWNKWKCMIMELQVSALGECNVEDHKLMNVKEPDCPVIARNGHIKVLFFRLKYRKSSITRFCPTLSYPSTNMLYIHILYVTGACYEPTFSFNVGQSATHIVPST